MENRPGFFKFYIPSLGEENQKIPPRFVQSVQGTWPMNLALRDRYNNLWNVKVEIMGGDWYFKDGWTKFADDNMIRGGDVLVYECFAQGLLDFKVHGRFACLTEGAGGRKTENNEERIINIESDDDVVGHTDEIDYDPIDDGENLRDDYYKVEKLMDDDTDTDDYDSSTEEENRHDDHFQMEQVMDDTDEDRSVPATEEENRSFHLFEAEEVADGTTNSTRRSTRRDYDRYGAGIFKTGLVPQPRNPYFVTKIRRNRPGELYLPMDVIKCYNLKLPETATLLDPHGRQFSARLKIWSDERTFYFGGWKGLCRVNMVEDDNTCICEFLRNGDDLSIRVSFFPPK